MVLNGGGLRESVGACIQCDLESDHGSRQAAQVRML